MDDPSMKKWKEEAEVCLFFGKRISEMDRDELLSAIGYLSAEITSMRERHTQDIDIVNAMLTHKE